MICAPVPLSDLIREVDEDVIFFSVSILYVLSIYAVESSQRDNVGLFENRLYARVHYVDGGADLIT